MDYILCLVSTTEEEKAMFRAALDTGDEIVFAPNGIREDGVPLTAEDYERVTVCIGNPPTDIIKNNKVIRLLQSRSAGVDPFLVPGVLRPEAKLCTAVGCYGHAVSEALFAMTLALMKKLHIYRDQQHDSFWKDRGPADTFEDAEVLVIGTGDIGSYYARYAKAFGAHTVGVRRDKTKAADGIDEMHDFSELDSLIPKADVIVMFLPHTVETNHLMNADRLALMKPTAFIVNGGRGTAIDCLALTEMLHKGQIAGAALDVTEPEPLPADHPLWKEPRVLITPHNAGGDSLPTTTRKIIKLSYENYIALKEGRELKNEVIR